MWGPHNLSCHSKHMSSQSAMYSKNEPVNLRSTHTARHALHPRLRLPNRAEISDRGRGHRGAFWELISGIMDTRAEIGFHKEAGFHKHLIVAAGVKETTHKILKYCKRHCEQTLSCSDVLNVHMSS